MVLCFSLYYSMFAKPIRTPRVDCWCLLNHSYQINTFGTLTMESKSIPLRGEKSEILFGRRGCLLVLFLNIWGEVMISSGMTEMWTHQDGSSSMGRMQSGSQLAVQMLWDELTLCTVKPLWWKGVLCVSSKSNYEVSHLISSSWNSSYLCSVLTGWTDCSLQGFRSH